MRFLAITLVLSIIFGGCGFQKAKGPAPSDVESAPTNVAVIQRYKLPPEIKNKLGLGLGEIIERVGNGEDAKKLLSQHLGFADMENPPLIVATVHMNGDAALYKEQLQKYTDNVIDTWDKSASITILLENLPSLAAEPWVRNIYPVIQPVTTTN